MIKVLIVDDHPMIREGLSTMFASRERFAVAGTAAGAEEALEFCRVNGLPDVVLSDIVMPRRDGLWLLEQMLKEFPDAKVLLLAGMPRAEEEEWARSHGAKGYVSKSMDTIALADAVAGIASGMLEFVTDSYVPVKSPFTEKQLETLKYLALGKTREEIAIIQGCAAETVKSRITEIRRKMDASNVTAAVFRAQEMGYIRL
ncbi:MAG: response regulator transcription factor [Kiritimatiellae bacterium]|nr:response regulator transcription factor [Kiritimatiellia bacterium]